MPHNGIFVAIETLFFIRRRRSLSSHRILNASHPQNSLHFAIFRTLYEYHTRWKYMICIMSNGENVHWLQLNELSLTHAHQFIYDDRTSRLQIQCRTEIFAWCNGSLSLSLFHSFCEYHWLRETIEWHLCVRHFTSVRMWMWLITGPKREESKDREENDPLYLCMSFSSSEKAPKIQSSSLYQFSPLFYLFYLCVAMSFPPHQDMVDVYQLRKHRL